MQIAMNFFDFTSNLVRFQPKIRLSLNFDAIPINDSVNQSLIYIWMDFSDHQPLSLNDFALTKFLSTYCSGYHCLIPSYSSSPHEFGR
jgi:hypothetical protein